MSNPSTPMKRLALKSPRIESGVAYPESTNSTATIETQLKAHYVAEGIALRGLKNRRVSNEDVAKIRDTIRATEFLYKLAIVNEAGGILENHIDDEEQEWLGAGMARGSSLTEEEITHLTARKRHEEALAAVGASTQPHHMLDPEARALRHANERANTKSITAAAVAQRRQLGLTAEDDRAADKDYASGY